MTSGTICEPGNFTVRDVLRTFRQLCQVSTLDEVIRLQENFTKPRLSDRVVLQVELVETVEGILVSVHI